MKKVFIGFGLIVVILLVVGFVFKNPLVETFKDVIAANMFVSDDTDDFNPGTNVGDTFPSINATYNGNQVWSIDEFSGQKGTVFVVSRSIVWCPYCMKQMIDLNENLSAFEQAGINIVGLTYDPPEGQQPFKDKYSISYPILSDNNATTVIALGILNEDHSPGDEAYGIGHPGAFVINAQGIVVGKVFLEAYSSRVDALSTLKYAQELLQ